MKTFASLAIENMPIEDSDQTASAQAGLNLHWMHVSIGISDIAAQYYIFINDATFKQLSFLSSDLKSWIHFSRFIYFLKKKKKKRCFYSNILSFTMLV